MTGIRSTFLHRYWYAAERAWAELTPHWPDSEPDMLDAQADVPLRILAAQLESHRAFRDWADATSKGVDA